MIEHAKDAEAIFLAALDKESQERAAYVEEACAGNANLLRRVRELLGCHDESHGPLDAPPPGLGGSGDVAAIREGPGTIIGPYRLMEQIGEGGMGLVFVAEQQQPVRRAVALKVIKPGMDTREVIARFEAERQALALMDHPHIARVLDAGATPTGRPYFVMELVKGVPITQFCDDHRLTPRQRLELFVSVCQAVQHAHQKGIIHRDVKPSNVLVSSHDGTPVVKVIDFGVAKAVGQHLTEKTVYTGMSQMLGTPLYMSPEQAGMSDLDIDTRTDIYALGVLLYELMTGTTPFEGSRLREASYDEIRRIIREEEPPKPSTRISTLGQAAATVSANRQSDPKKLGQLLRGELDWIVMKALEKDRNRRYETASAFAADVQRYLHDEPVLACPPSAWYRFRKFARRNKAALVTATAVALAVLLAVTGLAVGYAQINDALRHEKQVLEREQQSLYFQRLKTAARELAANNLGRAELSLDECPPDRRGWEWHYLKRRRYQDPRGLPHPDVVLSVAYSPNGHYLALGGLDGTVAVWNTRTWQQVYVWEEEHADHIYTVAFSPDGKYLATGGNDKKIVIRNLSGGGLLYTLEGHDGTIRQLAFSPDGRRLASASDDKTVRLWDMGTGQESFVFREHTEAVQGVAFLAGGQRLVSASADGTVQLWSPTPGARAGTYQARIRWVSSMAFDPQSQQLALGSWDGTVELWDDLPAREVRLLESHTAHVTGLAFNRDGRRLVSAGDDRALKVWDTTSGQEALALDIGDIVPIGLAFSPDGLQLAVTCGQRKALICDGTPLSGKEKREEVLTLTGHQDLVLQVAFSADSRRLASAGRDGTVKIWDALTGQDLSTFRGHTAIVSAAAFSPDGRRVASGSWDGKVLVWEVLNGEVVYSLSGQAGFVYDVAFSPNGQYLASAHANGTVILWDPRTGEPIHRIPAHGYEAVSVAFDRDSRLLATAGGRDHTAKVWDVRTAKKALALEIETTERASGRIRRVAFSPDGKWLATVGHGNVAKTSCVMIWDAGTGKRVGILEGRTKRLFHAAFSPDGRWIASGGQDEAVWVWEAATGAEGPILRGHAGEVLGMAFSPDGRFLASCGGYRGRGEIKIWAVGLWKRKD